MFSQRLFESPAKTPIRQKRQSSNWLSENTETPELNRVRGTLASKLDLITIETRKGIYC